MFIGNFPETGVERHFRAIGEETRRAMDTILDIESSSSGDPNKPDLPSMEEIDAEESEEARLRAERRRARRSGRMSEGPIVWRCGTPPARPRRLVEGKPPWRG